MDDRAKPTDWVSTLIEIAPLATFSLSGRLGLDITHRFYLGACIAILVAAYLVFRSWIFNPLFAAVNIWLCLEAAALGSGLAGLIGLVATLEESAFFATMLTVSLGYFVFSSTGLFPRRGIDERASRRGSMLLLGLIAISLIWSFAWRGDEQIAAVIPATLIFLFQQYWPVGRRG